MTTTTQQHAITRDGELLGTTVLDQTVPARAPWSAVVKAGQVLTIVDLGGNQAVDCILYNAVDTDDRYSAAATMSAQANIFLTTGSQLRTFDDTVLMTVVVAVIMMAIIMPILSLTGSIQ